MLTDSDLLRKRLHIVGHAAAKPCVRYALLVGSLRPWIQQSPWEIQKLRVL